MLIQDHERFDVVAEFDPVSGRLEPMTRPIDLKPGDADGWFSTLGDTRVIFYRQDGRLWLRIGDQQFDLDGETSVDWHRDGKTAVFAVADSNGQVILRYMPGPPGPPLEDDTTPFVESEDWDLGLFVTQVLCDEERRDLMRNRRA